MATKKKVSAPKEDKEKVLEELLTDTPPTRPVHQVVEVVEEDEDSRSAAATLEEAIPEKHTEEATPDVNDDDDTVEVSAEATPTISHMGEPVTDMPAGGEVEEPSVAPATRAEVAEQVKRKEMVDELFQPQKEMIETPPSRPAPVMPEITMHKKRSLMPMLTWAAIVIVVAALTGGGLFLLTQGQGNGLVSIVAQPTPTPEPTAAPTPTPVAPARDAVTIEILNGSGESGVAGKMEAVLVEKGYTVERKGNADNFEYEETEIHVKSDKEAYLSLLEEDLQDSYTIGAKAADLPEDSDYDVQIIVGQK